ncbi:MAG: hypothetical protein HFH84_17115 [Lachnospiraceae bacterium]|nr:hypothetical protein [Lachnospiraceae bacterium]
MEDDSTVLGIVDRAAEPDSDAEDAGTGFGGQTVPQPGVYCGCTQTAGACGLAHSCPAK